MTHSLSWLAASRMLGKSSSSCSQGVPTSQEEKNKHNEKILSSWRISSQWVRSPPINGLNAPIKSQRLSDKLREKKKKRTNDQLSIRDALQIEKHRLKVMDEKKMYQEN